MATNIDVIKAEIARIERDLDDAKRKLARAEQAQNGSSKNEPLPFSKLRGIWKGADFSYEEIKAAEYQLHDPDHPE